MKSSMNCGRVISATILLLTLAFTSCKKGEAGTDGVDGPPGTANVMYTDWLTPTAGKDSTSDGSNVKVQYVIVDSLTDQIRTSGTVLVYFTYGSSILPLPYTSFAGGKTSTLSFIPMRGKIIITRYTHDNTASVGLGSNKYRVVLIPGGVSTNSTKSKALPIGTMPELYSDDNRYSDISYDDIIEMFSISKTK